MSIFTGIRAAFGNLKFEELSPQGSYPFIRIKGINTRLLEIDLRKIFKTSKVYSSIFDQLDRYTLVFPSFFAIEVEMIMQRIISEKTRLGANTQTHVYIAALDTGNEQNMSTRTLSILQWSQSQIEAITGVKSPFEITDEQMSIESHGNLSYYDIDKHVEDFYLRKLS